MTRFLSGYVRFLSLSPCLHTTRIQRSRLRSAIAALGSSQQASMHKDGGRWSGRRLFQRGAAAAMLGWSQWSCCAGMEAGSLFRQEKSAQDESGYGWEGISLEPKPMFNSSDLGSFNTIPVRAPRNTPPVVSEVTVKNQVAMYSKFYVYPQREGAALGQGWALAANGSLLIVLYDRPVWGPHLLAPGPRISCPNLPASCVVLISVWGACFDPLIGSGRGGLICMGKRL